MTCVLTHEELIRLRDELTPELVMPSGASPAECFEATQELCRLYERRLREHPHGRQLATLQEPPHPSFASVMARLRGRSGAAPPGPSPS